MRVGVVLPTFREDATGALAVADSAEAAGVDGVFCYDHLWPLGQPERPALAPFPVLATIARRCPNLHVGTLVARIGLVPDDVLVSQFAALAALAPDRVVAGLGTGDHLSAPENEAYGVPPGSARERRQAVGRCALAVGDLGIPVWIGGASRPTRAVAEAVGAAVNLWNATPNEVRQQAVRTEVTWGGPVPQALPPAPPAPRVLDDRPVLTRLLDELADAGATWAVFAWPAPLEILVTCAREVSAGR
jgi:alkanesulfonate monooxygenase SsuD/methylene tetrahydromethanopterin reductase-like flavin-dependent oxidoreductase (luciferase family)